jgi:DNA-binding MarR family transcriptional regulator
MTATERLRLGPPRLGRLDHETRAADDAHIDLKIWLRLLTCSVAIERHIRQRLRARFGMTLPRFDYLAQLDRHPGGIRMNVLSQCLMVTGGSITGLTDELVKEGLVERLDDPGDRRSYLIALTPKGRRDFAIMAAEHERWLTDLFDGLGATYKRTVYDQLGKFRSHVATRSADLDRAGRVPARSEDGPKVARMRRHP